MIGRYPEFDVLASADTWDTATRAVVERRLRTCPDLRFFTAEEEPALRAFCDTAMAQEREPRVPVAELIDEKLAAGRLDGYQYADMPDDRECWRLVLRGLDEVAREVHGAASFADCGEADRGAIVERFSKGLLGGGAWDRLNVGRAWSVCMRMVLGAFYSHPWAWNEIGFGGPAYTRGFMRLGPVATREPFERGAAVDPDPVRDP
jgi:hypothetical protein